jgi:site-specific recombinase XerD
MGNPMDLDKLAQRVIRPLVKSIEMEWYGWHRFRRGIASNLYKLGADEKVVQRILRHAKIVRDQRALHQNIRSCGACSDEKTRDVFGYHHPINLTECRREPEVRLGEVTRG